jgi:dihydroorotate dehydrogenase
MLPPEAAHNLSLWALRNNIIPDAEIYINQALETEVFGLKFRNPVGLSAGYDKNAECMEPLEKQDFGFVEVGTVTPLPQKGNKKPRIFRVPEQEAVINRLGFNNKGVELFSQKLRKWKYSSIGKHEMVVGANIGRNKNSPNNADDYITSLERLYGLCDYLTINISSPNTQGLRDLQNKEHLHSFLKLIIDRKNKIVTNYKGEMPLLLKISPDESDESLKNIAEVVLKLKVDGVIISNTSVSDDLAEKGGFAEKKQQGGISGKPIFELSTSVLEKFYKLTKGKIPLIGVGGISSAEDAYEKIKKGASLVQLYTGLIYNGFELVNDINKGLVDLLKADGYKSVGDAVGVDVK